MVTFSRRAMAATAGLLVLLGLGLLGAFLLPSSGAQNTAGTYTYPTTTKPPPTTTTESTTETKETTTQATTAPETTAAATTTTVETTTGAPEPATTTTSAPTTTTAAPPAPPRSSRRLRASRNRALGADIVVDEGGRTLYHMVTERNHRILCTGGCAIVWPPLLVPRGAKPLAGKGVSARRLGTIRRPDGRLQWTYAGLPLYGYSGDRKPGDANGQGIGSVWFAVGPAGRIVRR